MKRAALALMLSFASVAAPASEGGFAPGSCAEIRGAVEVFLALADAKFREADSLREAGNTAVADARFSEAAVLSGLASDYSTVFATFCKH